MALGLPRSLSLLATFVVAALAAACGDKGDSGDDTDSGGGGKLGSSGASGQTSAGSGGSGGGSGGTAAMAKVLYGFDTTDEGFKWEDYEAQPPLVNLSDKSTLSWDDGAGQDGNPGRLKLEIPFDDFNQLADIQLNIAMPGVDYTGKTLIAYVNLESGFSPNPSHPGGSYIFVKTGAAWSWARGDSGNLSTETVGQWVKLQFSLQSPQQTADAATYDQASVVAIGIQLYSGSGAAGAEPPTPVVAYVDNISLQ